MIYYISCRILAPSINSAFWYLYAEYYHNLVISGKHFYIMVIQVPFGHLSLIILLQVPYQRSHTKQDKQRIS